MSLIRRTITVNFEHRVYFTRGVFNVSNPLLQSVLADPARPPKVLVVVDASLAQAQPLLNTSIENYFAAFAGSLELVAPPLVIEGGERAKSTYTHVS